MTGKERQQWVEWLEDQLDTTNNASYHMTGKNRVFLTQEDDIDIAKYILESFLKIVKENEVLDRDDKINKVIGEDRAN